MMMSNMIAPTTATVTSAEALRTYDFAVGLGEAADKIAWETVAHNLARALRQPKAVKAPKAAPADDGTLTAESLRAALAYVCFVVEKRNSIPILSNVHMKAKGGVLVLTATDLDFETKVELKAAGTPDFCVTVEADKLRAILGKASGAVSIEHEMGNPRVSVSMASGGEIKLPIIPAGDFPFMERKAPTCFEMIDAARFRQALAAVRVSVSTEETRYYLNGVYMHQPHIDGQLRTRFVATDGSRMVVETLGDASPAWQKKPKGATCVLDAGILIPRKTVDFLLKFLPKTGEAYLATDGTQFQVAANGFDLCSKLIDGNFPDYGRVLPAEDDFKVGISVEDPIKACAALRQALAISNEKSRSVRLQFGPAGEVVAIVRNMESGNAVFTIPGVTTKLRGGAPNREISVNGNYLVSAFMMGEGLPVLVNVGGPNDPIRFDVLGMEEGTRMGVLMPLRV